jgi:hypothetical protein
VSVAAEGACKRFRFERLAKCLARRFPWGWHLYNKEDHVIKGAEMTTKPIVTPRFGGTGSAATPTNGQMLIGNGTGYTLGTLTAGTGITVTNGAGSITIAATAGAGGNIDPVIASMIF